MALVVGLLLVALGGVAWWWLRPSPHVEAPQVNPVRIELQKPAAGVELRDDHLDVMGTVEHTQVGDRVRVLLDGAPRAETPVVRRAVIAIHERFQVSRLGEHTVRVEVRRDGEVVASREHGLLRTVSLPKSCEVSDAQRQYAHEHNQAPFFENHLGMWFVLIPPGQATLGSAEDPTADPDEVGRDVKLRNPLYLQVGEVTNAQFRRFDPTHQSGTVGEVDLDGATHPVVRVSHERAQAFAHWLSQADRRRQYRLPTEAEWEYAARAGASYYVKELRDDVYAHVNCADEATRQAFAAWALDVSGEDGVLGPAAREQFPANPWGLRNMMGNVAEWCSDWYGPVVSGLHWDPLGPPTGTARVVRGGSWASEPIEMRVSNRSWFPGILGDPFIGFRLVAVMK